jgi:hypothetical protein
MAPLKSRTIQQMGATTSVAIAAAAMPHPEFLQAAQGKPLTSSVIGRWMSTPQKQPQQQPQQQVHVATTNTANVVKALGI